MEEVVQKDKSGGVGCPGACYLDCIAQQTFKGSQAQLL